MMKMLRKWVSPLTFTAGMSVLIIREDDGMTEKPKMIEKIDLIDDLKVGSGLGLGLVIQCT